MLAHAHLQTLVSALLRPLPEVTLRRERLELDDGDFVDLGWSGEHNAAGPIAVLVHGLGGGFQSKYLRGCARRLAGLGWRTVALELRGGGPETNRLSRAYHQGDTADLRYIWHRLRRREPDAFLASVGWSMGGNIVLKALGEEGDGAPIDAAFAVGVPFDMRLSSEHIRHGFARVYQSDLLKIVKGIVRAKQHMSLAPADAVAALAARDFFEFDDAFTAPLNDFRDAADYHQRASSCPYLPHIRRTTLIVHALDDPMMCPQVLHCIPELPPCVTLEVSSHGGHIGFIAADRLLRPVWWLEERIASYLQGLHRNRIPTARSICCPLDTVPDRET